MYVRGLENTKSRSKAEFEKILKKPVPLMRAVPENTKKPWPYETKIKKSLP